LRIRSFLPLPEKGEGWGGGEISGNRSNYLLEVRNIFGGSGEKRVLPERQPVSKAAGVFQAAFAARGSRFHNWGRLF